jgi:hypothetical protein
VQQIKTWWVMRDPAGLPFCVVRVQTGELFEQLGDRMGLMVAGGGVRRARGQRRRYGSG